MALSIMRPFGRAKMILEKTVPVSVCRADKSTATFDLPPMPECDVTPLPHEGPTFQKAMETRAAHLPPGFMTFYREPVYIHQGHMQYLWDTAGKRYIDLFGGIVTISVGHCHPKVVKAAEKQLRKLWHTTNIYLHPTIHQYAAELVSRMPGKLKVVFFTNSGSEANDLAILMARLHTGVFDCISLRNGYHGASPYTMGVSAMSTWRYNTPTGFGFQNAMNADVYRGIWGGKHCRDSPSQTDRPCDCSPGQCTARDMYVDQVEDVMRYSMPKSRVGAFIAEAIQGGGGAVQLPDGYLKAVYEKVRARGGVCIADEVQTAWGRLGSHYWGFQSQGMMPDIVTLAKGIGNGFPLAAVVTTPEIAATMGKANHFNTFGGNPVACAVGSAVLEVIDEEGMQANSATVGTYFIEELDKLKAEFEVVGDVRGKGLMIGLELVNDKESRTPLNGDDVTAIMEDTKDMGCLFGRGGMYSNVLRIKPPMCLTREDVDYSVAALRLALHRLEDGKK